MKSARLAAWLKRALRIQRRITSRMLTSMAAARCFSFPGTDSWNKIGKDTEFALKKQTQVGGALSRFRLL